MLASLKIVWAATAKSMKHYPRTSVIKIKRQEEAFMKGEGG